MLINCKDSTIFHTFASPYLVKYISDMNEAANANTRMMTPRVEANSLYSAE
jgi:hypothetical protein